MPLANRVNLRERSSRGVSYTDGHKRQGASNTWFRGDHTNFNPSIRAMATSRAVVDHILPGWLPDRPLIGHGTNIVAFGSCFATNIANWLESRDFNLLSKKGGEAADTYLVRFGEGLVTTFALRQQFEWAVNNKQFPVELWHGYDGKGQRQDEELRRKTRDLILKGDVFVITLGLSEIWYDEPTGEAFWRAVPRELHDPSRHKFRISTVSENKANLVELVKLIHQVKPEAKIIFTLSPIPLVATFRDNSCITANAVSKAVLRAAIDETLREIKDPQVYYWPSYEIVMHAFKQPWSDDRRHVVREVLDFVMTTFETVWCHGSTPRMTIAEAWLKACAAADMCPDWLPEAVENEDIDKVLALYQKERVKVVKKMRAKAANKDTKSEDYERGEPTAFAAALDRIKEIAEARPDGPTAKWLAGDLPRVIQRLLNPDKVGAIRTGDKPMPRERRQEEAAAAL